MFSWHIHSTYQVNVLLEPSTAAALHDSLPFPTYSSTTPTSPSISSKTDLVTTLGGDGTILRASSLFSHTPSVPPILSFSLGSLGFLSEWHFHDHKRAFREVYVSGSLGRPPHPLSEPSSHSSQILPGLSLGASRPASILLRSRLSITAPQSPPIYALNELVLHRGATPHLTHIDISVGGRHLTTAVGDGLIISSPSGSTAYSLSAGGAIIHPLVPGLLITPICPRSLSFRPLVLPADSKVGLRVGEANRGGEIEMSVDGGRSRGVKVGMEVGVVGEGMVRGAEEGWTGGVPCVMRGVGGDGSGDEAWMGGLNGLLKFNHPFGEES
ncbi:MAG: NADH kinase pos5 [Vezdaea aestivalis]|nr:MAG: NADH kinase pos5 [Vezdaea aestivalis]